MKTAVQIIAYCLWFGFTLWLSVWFLIPAGWIEGTLLPAKTSFQIELAVRLILLAGFSCLFAVLPILWMRRRGQKIVQKMVRNMVFIALLLTCSIFCTYAWNNWIAGKLYNCTDSVPFDFLRPGNWVHSHDGISVAVVPKINPSDSMDKPDTIKEGWSVLKLWLLWWSFVFASVAVSAVLAFLFFRLRKPKVAQAVSP
jgi:hypothetical protein